MTRLAETPPTHCSSCYGQYTDRRHVDFEAAWDGPTFTENIATGDGRSTPNIGVTIDDLIVCEDCMAEAAKLLGLVRADEVVANSKKLEGQNENLRDRLSELVAHVAKLEAAVASKPKRKVAA